jgi:hypothetical protein
MRNDLECVNLTWFRNRVSQSLQDLSGAGVGRSESGRVGVDRFFASGTGGSLAGHRHHRSEPFDVAYSE